MSESASRAEPETPRLADDPPAPDQGRAERPDQAEGRAAEEGGRPRAARDVTAITAALHPPRATRGRARQDQGLGPDDVVELTVRGGIPRSGEWVDAPADAGYEELADRAAEAGQAGSGLNLVAAPDYLVPNEAIRFLRTLTLPCRLVRRPAHEG
jgi:hypothetical protein